MVLYSVKTSESLFGTEPFSVLLFEKISGQPGCLTPWPGLEGHYWPTFSWEGRSRGCGSPGPSRHVQTVVGGHQCRVLPAQGRHQLLYSAFFFFSSCAWVVIWNHGQLIRWLDGRSQPWPSFSSQLSLRDRLVSMAGDTVGDTEQLPHPQTISNCPERGLGCVGQTSTRYLKNTELTPNFMYPGTSGTYIYSPRLNTTLSVRDRRIRPIIYVTPDKPQALFPSYFTPKKVRSNSTVQEWFV